MSIELVVCEWLVWYNNERLHRSLGYVPPVEFDELCITKISSMNYVRFTWAVRQFHEIFLTRVVKFLMQSQKRQLNPLSNSTMTTGMTGPFPSLN